MYYKKPTDILAVLNGIKKYDPLRQPLTFTALSENCSIKFAVNSTTFTPNIEYSLNKKEWYNSEDFIQVPLGGNVYFRGLNPIGIYVEGDYVNWFEGSGQWNVSGNIMTLIDYTNTPTEMVGRFSSLFGRNLSSEPESIDIIDSSLLQLPATILTESCYKSMFAGCKNMKTQPVLPATELADYCYHKMFAGCTALESIKSLPATTLKAGCYYGMYSNCPALSGNVILPATTLATRCYTGMFGGCSNIDSIDVSISNWGAQSTDAWVEGVAASGTFTCPAGLSQIFDSSHIPTGWTVVTK